MSVMKFRGLLDRDLTILTSALGSPQNVGVSFNGGAYPGKNANISLGAQNQSANAASLIVVADNVDNLNINLDGYSGKQGKSSAQICAQKIKDGVYGVPLQTYFNTRRANTSADPDRCDADDLNYMQTFNFTCDDPSYSEVSASDPTVQVLQIKKQARCTAVSSYNYCIKKKMDITCNYRLWSSFRQQWLDPNTLGRNSYANATPVCNTQTISCGTIDYSCLDQNFNFGLKYGYNNGRTIDPACAYKSTGAPLCNPSNGSDYTSNIQTVEVFRVGSVCNTTKVPGMSFNKSVVLAGVEEEFYNSESSRLGGVDGFCDAYGPKPGKDNQDWWGGVPGGPPNALGTVSGQGGIEVNGIPYEYMGSSGSVFVGNPPEPSGASPSWKNETVIQGGYQPLVNTDRVSDGGFGSVYNFYTKSAYWKGQNSGKAYTFPGLNSDGLTLAPGSTWQTMQTNTFESCPTGWSVLKSVFLNLIQYTNKENTACSGVSDPQDPNNRAFWQYTGITQEPSFGTETVSCNIGTCAVGSTVSESSRSLDVILPASGENGTEQGRGLLFVYDVRNITSSAIAGGSGATGLADININPQTKICAKIDDANAGINSPQAKNPFVSFRRYSWQALKSASGGNPGSPPRNSGKSVELYKKLDPAARYLLDKSLL
jgi:hypothetical protein